MNTFITSHSEWLEQYKKDKNKTWIRATLTDQSEIYLRDYSEWDVLKSHCELNSLGIDKIGLQYKSHHIEVDTAGSDGVYLVRSILGSMGQNVKHTFTIGKLSNNEVEKSIWIVPELIKEIEEKDKIENCFEQAFIYNYAKSK